MGLDSPDDESLISTYDPALGKWTSQTVQTMRDVSKYRSLLYRARNVTSKASGMEKEVEAISGSSKSRKRPAPNENSPDRLQLVKKSKPNTSPRALRRPPLQVHQIKAEPTEDVIELSDDSTPPPGIQTPTRPSSSKPQMTINKDFSEDEDNSDPNNEDSQDDKGLLATMSNSNHASWPLRYVSPMSEGFEKMSTMNGKLEDRFLAAFGLPFPAKATYHLHKAVWDQAPQTLRRKYIRAKCTKGGLWKAFKVEVRALFPDGKIPGARASKSINKNTEKSTSKKSAKVSQKHGRKSQSSIHVKDEPTDISMPVRFQVGSSSGSVIEISDDE